MFRGVVNGVPLVLLMLGVLVLGAGVVLLAVRLVRRFVPATRDGFDAEVSSQMLGVVAAMFGLLLAFVIVIAYQNFGDTEGNVIQEADDLAAIARDSEAFGEPDAARVKGAIGTYVRIVVDEEWPRMRDGHDSARAWDAMNGVFAALQSVEPRSPAAVAFYEDSVRHLNTALDARRDRLADAGGGFPWVLGVLLGVGALIILGYAVLVGSTSFWFHAVGAGTLAVVIGLSLVVLLSLNYPFSGDLAIDSKPFRTGVLAGLSR